MSAIERNPNSKDKSKSERGALIIAARLKVTADKQLLLDSCGSGPWKLLKIIEWDGDEAKK